MQIIKTHSYSQGIAQRGSSGFPRPSKEVQLALPSFACPRAVGFPCLTYLQVDGQKRGCSKGASPGASIVTTPAHHHRGRSSEQPAALTRRLQHTRTEQRSLKPKPQPRGDRRRQTRSGTPEIGIVVSKRHQNQNALCWSRGCPEEQFPNLF